jgi:dihydrofolate synthase/folylpolyglutamate synthase
MSYAAAIDQLSAMTPELFTQPGHTRRKFSLDEIGILLAAMGNPHHRFPSVLIAGTNGKGSTAATLASILTASGLCAGLYTSPHLTRPNERIRVNGVEITDDAFASLYFRVHDCGQQLVLDQTLAQLPSFFETLTAMAFLHFAESALHTCVDIAILEVGMGGRLDATNIVDPILSIVTDISLDHTEWLGPTIAAIAREKAGILRSNGTLITLPQHPEANQVLGEIATELGVRAISAVPYMPQTAPLSRHSGDPNLAGFVTGHDFSRVAQAAKGNGALAPGGSTYSVEVLNTQIEVASPLHGAHQHRNIALAIAAAVELATHHALPITAASIEQGIRTTHWPARLEVIATRPRQACSDLDRSTPHTPACHPENPHAGGPASDGVGVVVSLSNSEGAAPPQVAQWILDVAHNPAGAWALRAALRSLLDLDAPSAKPATLIFGCLRDKPIAEMAQILFPIFDRVIFAPIHSPRATPMADLLAAAASTGTPATAATSVAEAIELAESSASAANESVRPASTAARTASRVVVAGSVYLVGEARALLLARAGVPA